MKVSELASSGQRDPFGTISLLYAGVGVCFVIFSALLIMGALAINELV